MFKNKDIHFFAKLAIMVAISTIALKSIAYLFTGSVGLLSDAIESLVNLATAIITLYSIRFAQEPEDDRHQFGHSKIEYFSSLAEGFFIAAAGLTIILTAAERVIHPAPIENIGVGILVSIFASALNGFAAYHMFKASKKFNSIALKADAHHLMTDVYTTGAIIVGVFLVLYFNMPILDPIIAILMGLNILKTSVDLISKSFHGLIDESIPEQELSSIRNIISDTLTNSNVKYVLKSRASGRVKFVYLNLGIPNDWGIKKAHDLTMLIEEKLYSLDSEIKPFIHIEPESDFLHDQK